MTRRPFLWGAAISAHQTEGQNQESDWWIFERRILARRGLQPSLRAADHWNRYKDDLDLLANAGLNAFRCSIEWAKIEPQEGKISEEALEHYAEVFAYAKQKNINLCVTLWHFSLPQWAAAQGGMRSAHVRNRFLQYVRLCVERLDPLVDLWQTMNEPMVYASEAYRWGSWPPNIRSHFAALRMTCTLRALHRQTYAVIRSLSAKPIGIAKSMIAYLATPRASLWTRMIQHFRNFSWNRFFFVGQLRWHDFIGINYYITSIAGRKKDIPTAEKDDMGWECRPEGLVHCIQSASRMGKPIYITENGIATDEDEQRIRYLDLHLTSIQKEAKHNPLLHGYFFWSLIDNYEWDKGFTKRFGLVSYLPVTYARVPKPSLSYYGQRIKEHPTSKSRRSIHGTQKK
ncbi:MAG: family 1 glycosylhydrolase [Candidatus Uhrbacteria bacterium]|nr:family 1 glycosylhydrolase [Candidatus Uhrbacteria bacterium]